MDIKVTRPTYDQKSNDYLWVQIITDDNKAFWGCIYPANKGLNKIKETNSMDIRTDADGVATIVFPEED